NDFQIIKNIYQHEVKKIFPNTYTSSNTPSTVIEINDNNFKILRTGSINLKKFTETFISLK
ncbi:MAG: threonylcarbamoyl-AMP synthase, partial [Candidatus Phytoplasma australasiaticum]|nr:threonylcarbamoyl-AMP synthase [Candidatus Phytoplasma australasiaticum]